MRSSVVALIAGFALAACGGSPRGSTADAGQGGVDAAGADAGGETDGHAGSDAGGHSLDAAAGADATPPPPDAGPATGNPDPGFGSGGVVTVDRGGDERAADVVVQPDGKAVVVGSAAGGMLALRLDANGALDPTFGAAGAVVLAVGDFGAEATSVVRQPDGKLVVGGQTYRGGYTRFTLVRLTASGALDPTFGDGGVAMPLPDGTGGVTDLALQPDGKIVATGYGYPSFSFSQDAVVFRVDASGALDTGFGTGGAVTTYYQGYGDVLSSIALQADGKIVAVGTGRYEFGSGGGTSWWLLRYTAAGALDASFAGGGWVTPPVDGVDNGAAAVVLRPDGRILSTGFGHDDSGGGDELIFYQADAGGHGDGGFGSFGQVIDTSALSAYGTALALQHDGMFVVGADVLAPSTYQFALWRRQASGAPDPGFGSGSRLQFHLGSESHCKAVALAPGGAIIAVGWMQGASNADLVVVKVL